MINKIIVSFFLFGIYSQLFGWQIFPCEPLKGFFQCLFVCSKKLAKHILQSWPIHTLSFEWRWSRSFIRLITHSFSSCELLMKEAKKVRSLYIFCEKNIYSIIPRFCIKDRKVTVWKKKQTKQNKNKNWRQIFESPRSGRFRIDRNNTYKIPQFDQPLQKIPSVFM